MLERMDFSSPSSGLQKSSDKPPSWYEPGYISTYIKDSQNEWENSTNMQEVKKALQGITLPPFVTKIIGFGLGSVVMGRVIDKASTSPNQHRLLLELSRLFHSQKAPKCFSQDPMYHEAEIETYKEQGIQVLRDPQGFLAVDEDTVLVSIAETAPILAIAMDLVLPVAIIWFAQ